MQTTDSTKPDARQGRLQPPAEGADGLFSQSWFPVCLSQELVVGQVRGFDFLDGRIVVLRGENGVAQALSAYCPHLGADLAVGQVMGNEVRCAFHHWSYDCSGRCTRTGTGHPAPRSARLFRFPTVEKYGVIYIFNGETPLFDLPGFPFPEEELLVRSERIEIPLPVDPWVICCNTPDIQHIRVVHGVAFDDEDPGKSAQWTDHSMVYSFSGKHAMGEQIRFDVGIYGTSIFYQAGEMLGRWFGFIAPIGLPRPGCSDGYLTIAVRRDEPDAEAYLQSIIDLEKRVVSEDADILATIRFRPGTLTPADQTLARFLRYLRLYPRAHPSADYIR